MADILNSQNWGADLSSRVGASVFIVSIHNVAVVCVFEPRGGRYLLFTVWCQCALSVVCLRLILILVVKAWPNLDYPLYT